MSFIFVKADATRAIERMRTLEEQLEEEIDDGIERVAEDGVRRGQRQLRSSESVATGTGVSSLDTDKIGEHHYAVKGRSYLKLVDKGTDPHTPEINNRLIVWASQEGWLIDDIVEHIEEEGTDPNAWIEKAFDSLTKTADKKVAAHLRLNVDF